MYKLLIADDEPKLAESVCDYFSAKGWRAYSAPDGESAVQAAASVMPDLMLLDVLMPGMDGFSACREIRAFCDAPVIFLTALGEEENYLSGYGAGADDYIVKPFPLSVLLKKCEAAVSRYRGGDGNKQLSCGGLTLDLSARAVFAGARSLPVTGKDFDLLSLLMQNKGRTLGRETLLNRAWGYGFEGDIRVVDTHIKTLRKALGAEAGRIRTVVGVGYRFEEAAV